MIKKIIPCIAISFAIACNNSANNIASKDTITTNDTAANASKPQGFVSFIPDGYELLDTAAMDLNDDNITDLLLAIKKKNEQETSDVATKPEKRPLLLLVADASGNYSVSTKSDNAIMCVDCGGAMGDPFVTISTGKDAFTVEHMGGAGWRWTRNITFGRNKEDGKWYLEKEQSDNFHSSKPDKVKTTVKTSKDFGKLPFEKFDIFVWD